jgi:hypothetical protein
MYKKIWGNFIKCLLNLFLLAIICLYFFTIFPTIAHNVPAVYDVFAVAMKECEAFQQPQKCGWSVAWEWSEAE